MRTDTRPDPVRPGSLRLALIALAGRPEDDARIAGDLVTIARTADRRIGAVSFASVTRRCPEGLRTVAATSPAAIAADHARYADGTGLDTFDSGRPAALPAGTLAMLSVPLCSGRGTPVATLNLYGPCSDRLRALVRAVLAIYRVPGGDDADRLDAGGGELISGLVGASTVRMVIQRAVGVVMSMSGHDAEDAYGVLRSMAVETGTPLADTAARLVTGRRW